MADYKFYAFFVASKVGAASLTVTVDVYKASDDSKVVSDGAANEVAGGLYSYTYTTSTAGDYLAVFKTADTTVDAQQIPALCSQQVPEISEILVDTGTTLPAAISAIPTAPLLAANYTAPDNTSITAILEDTGTTLPALIAGGNGGSKTLDYFVQDSAGDPISGVMVELYADSGFTSLIKSKITDVLGYVHFYNLVAGTYYLKIIAPAGYDDATDTEVVA